MFAFFLHHISRSCKNYMLLFCLLHCRSLSQFQEFCCLPLGGDMTTCFHLLTDLQLQVLSPCCASYRVHSLWVAAPSHGLPPPPLLSLHPSFHLSITPSRSPALLKSAAIKTDAGLKCHKRISNCQNINLFTLRCLAFLRGEERVG